MSFTRRPHLRLLFSAFLLSCFSGFCLPALALNDAAVREWKDFIHYARVARPDLSAAHGRQLLSMNLPPTQLLEVIEQPPYAQRYDADLQQMQRMEGPIAEVARQVERAIGEAKLTVMRDHDRIAAEINNLAQGLRPRINATTRLKESGEYAVPQMLAILATDRKANEGLRPYVIEALVEMGRPVVVPLCEALPTLVPEAQQDVARIVGRIGYPVALPYLKRLAQVGNLDPDTLAVVDEAIQRVAEARGLPLELSPAHLFLMFGEDYYAARASLILDPHAEFNLRWITTDRGELTYQRIPTEIYPDVMAMQSARRALQLDPNLSEALSLWLAANFRRENNLPADKSDPSYGPEMRSPRYYATLAGPSHIKPVLARAMNEQNTDLALDALDALIATAGAESLVLNEGEAVLAALMYPDRRVRFETAFAVAHANPLQDFQGSGRVVPVLAEALRQHVAKVALVIGQTRDSANELAGQVRAAGEFEVLLGTSLEQAQDDMETVPAVDLIVIRTDAAYVNAFSVARRSSYKLTASPMVVVTTPDDLPTISRIFVDEPEVVVVDGQQSDASISAGISQALASMAGADLTDIQIEAYALQSLTLLSELVQSEVTQFDVMLAQPALIQALNDARPSVVQGAAAMLSLLATPEAQQAIAEAALDPARGEPMQIALLGNLADSARRYGPLTSIRQNDALLTLVDQSTGALADAAAQAHGALNLPTAHGVELITR